MTMRIMMVFYVSAVLLTMGCFCVFAAEPNKPLVKLKPNITKMGTSTKLQLNIRDRHALGVQEPSERSSTATGKERFVMKKKLFPTDLPEREFVDFAAIGYASPVSGVIFDANKPPCCGVPLGGIGTGCIDIDSRGVYGFRSIFNPKSQYPQCPTSEMPRKLPRAEPLLGLSIVGTTWVMATKEFIDGGKIPWCTDPYNSGGDPKKVSPHDDVQCTKIEGVKAVNNIHYWGHYPIADMEYETDAPVGVAMRAWASLIPGDIPASNIPAAVFEVHLRNTSSAPQTGTIAFNFPGPDAQEALGTEFTRRDINEDFKGVLVSSNGGVSYVLGVIGDEKVRLGEGLHSTPNAWSQIASRLPNSPYRENNGARIYQDSSSAAAVDFVLDAGAEKIVRFLVAWHAPVLEGASKGNMVAADRFKTRWLSSQWSGDTNHYTHMYAARYGSALDIARRMALEHDTLLKRVCSWQVAVYDDKTCPVWLRDVLVNSLGVIAENSYWVQAKPPIGDWAYPDGMFGMIDSSRGCPQTGCTPDCWIGSLPITYFFPEMMRSMLKGYRQYQLDDGEIPFSLGHIWTLPDFATPQYFWQGSLNGTCYISMVDRLWRCTGDDTILREFYDSVKRCNTFTMHLAPDPARAIRMPDRGGSEWFEHGVWLGKVTHIGGLHLAQLRIVERMAKKMGDTKYASQCRKWFDEGSAELENRLWADGYYLNFYDEKSDRTSDEVLAFQLDGDFLARHHGFDPVFRPDRAAKALETILHCNVALASGGGAVLFTKRDGSPIGSNEELTSYNSYNVFPSNSLLLFATYAYAGKRNTSLELTRRMYENLVLHQRHPWDMPNVLRGDTGERVYGTDYSQMMVVWNMVAALKEEDLSGPCKSGGLVSRMLATGSN